MSIEFNEKMVTYSLAESKQGFWIQREFATI